MVPAPSSPPPDRPLFVYGTLLFPEVLELVVGRVPASEPARLEGWRAAELPGKAYPGLVPAAGAVRGLVLVDLGPDERHRIHEFEDDMYDLIEVALDDGRRAGAYAWRATSQVLPTDWDPERFAEVELAGWLRGG